MNNPTSALILTCDGFALRPELRTLAEEKTAKLLRHDRPRVHLVRAHVKHEAPHGAAPTFNVRATAEHAGPDHIVHASASEPAGALHAAFTKLERALRDAAGSLKRARHARSAADSFA